MTQRRGEFVQGAEIAGGAARGRVGLLHGGFLRRRGHAATSADTPVPLLLRGDPGTGAWAPPLSSMCVCAVAEDGNWR